MVRAAIMTVIQSCIAATIKGWLLYELQILIGKIQYIYMLNKNTLGAKKLRGQSEAAIKWLYM